MSMTLSAVEPPFTVQGPGVHPGDFETTVFANGLDFPLAMAELPDGSILAAVNPGSNFFNSTGRLLRFTDLDGDGISDAPPEIMMDGLPGKLTALKVVDSLVFVTGAARPLFIYRLNDAPPYVLTLAGRIDFAYPGGDYHAHSTLEIRKLSDDGEVYELFFQLGSDQNNLASTRTVDLSSESVEGVSGTLIGDSAYMLALQDQGTHMVMTELKQVATGLRNAAGFAFHPATGDLYLQDNGIDGLVNPNEPHSADELNVIAREDIGQTLHDFGFPENYTAYRTGEVVGGAGIQPLIAFQPISDPQSGARSEGANQMVFAPPHFPKAVDDGIFIGFHGKFMLGGIQNDENPVVYVNLQNQTYFHFIAGQQPGVGHLDGLLSTKDSLYIADLVTHGNLTNGAGAGVIYRIRSRRPPAPPRLRIEWESSVMRLEWEQNVRVYGAERPGGPWTRMRDIFSPHVIPDDQARGFFRAGY